MKRFSIQILFGLAFLTFVVSCDYLFFRYQVLEIYRKEFSRLSSSLEQESFFAKSYLEVKNDLNELETLLVNRQKGGHFNFWVILHQGVIYQSNIGEEEKSAFTFYLDAPGDLQIQHKNDKTVSYAYVTQNLNKDFQVVLGLRYDEAGFTSKEFDYYKGYALKFFVIFVIGAFLIFTYFFRDILAAIRGLSERRDRRFGAMKFRSKEAEVLSRGIRAYEDSTLRLEREKDMLKWQVLPSLRTEIMSGRKPPYDFNCTLVRTDINNFSKIYNDYSVDEFTQTINDFFVEVSHIVSRYGGLVHEFVGDEVIYYFKDEDVGNSVLKAIFAIRDINEAASEISRMTLEKRGYPFTVKSSFAHGKLRFAKFVNGYGLAGSTLIETVRILSQVVEKEGNVVVFDDRHDKWFTDLIEYENYATVLLKGFSFERRLMRYQKHVSLRTLFEKLEFEHLQYFRSDKDLRDLIVQARALVKSEDYQSAQRVIGVIRHISVTQSDGRPKKELLSWLSEMQVAALERDAKESGGRRTKRGPDHHLTTLSSAIRLVENLVPKADFDSDVEKVLQDAAQINDRRLIANALEVLSYFKADGDPRFAAKLVLHQDNRVAANALVHEGVRGISSFVVKRLKKMLASKGAHQKASALYALGEIAHYHKTHDLVYFSTQLEFSRLLTTIPDYVNHDDSMVRRQAMIAARKTDDIEITLSIWSIVRNSQRADLEREALEYLGEAPANHFDSNKKAA